MRATNNSSCPYFYIKEVIYMANSGNVASLGINVTGNIADINAQLVALQAQLKAISNQNVTVRLGNSNQINNMNQDVMNTNAIFNMLGNTIQQSMGKVGGSIFNIIGMLATLNYGIEKVKSISNIPKFVEKILTVSDYFPKSTGSNVPPETSNRGIIQTPSETATALAYQRSQIAIASAYQRSQAATELAYQRTQQIERGFLNERARIIQARDVLSRIESISITNNSNDVEMAFARAAQRRAQRIAQTISQTITMAQSQGAAERLAARANIRDTRRTDIITRSNIPTQPAWIREIESSLDSTLPSMTNYERRMSQIYTLGHQIVDRFNQCRVALNNWRVPLLSISAVIGSILVIGLAKAVQLTKDLVIEGLKYQRMLEDFATSFKVLMKPDFEIGTKTGGPNKIDIPSIGEDGITRTKEYNTTIGATVDFMKSLQTYANFSTFTFPELASEAERMQAYGLKIGDTLHMLRMLGDTSMGNKIKLQQQAYAMAQTITAGRLIGDNLRQFREGGFNPLQALAKEKALLAGERPEMAGKYMPGLQEEVEAGTIGIDRVVHAFEMATSEGGQYYGMQTEKAKTASGMISTIIDKWDMLRGKTQADMFEGLKPILDKIIGVIDQLLENVDVLSKAFSDSLLPVLQDVFSETANLCGFANGDQGFSSVTNAVVGWIEALAAGIKALMVLANVIIGVVSIFTSGILVIIMAFQSLWAVAKLSLTGIGELGALAFTGIAQIAETVVLGIAGAFEWCADKLHAPFAKAFNTIADGWNMLADKIGANRIETRMNVGSPSDLNVGSWDLLNKMTEDNVNRIEGIGQRGTDELTKIGEDWSSSFGASSKLLLKSAEISQASLENLFGDKKYDKIPGMKKNAPGPDPQKGITAISGAKTDTKDQEAAKAFASAWDQVTKAIDGALKKLTSLDTIFGKLSYENFSPSKLQARLKRYLKELELWNVNLKKLKDEGVADSIIGDLQSQGTAGFGITKALAKANPAQLKLLTENYAKVQRTAITSATSTIMMEHSGTIRVEGITTEGQLRSVINIIASDIVKDKASNSMIPALSSVFK